MVSLMAIVTDFYSLSHTVDRMSNVSKQSESVVATLFFIWGDDESLYL